VPLPFVGGFAVLGVVLFVAGFAIAPTLIAVVAWIEETVPARRLTEGIAIVTTGIGVGLAPGAAAVGEVIDRHGASVSYWVPVLAAWVAALVAVAEALGAPVVTSMFGRGAISDRHPLALGDGWGRLGLYDDVLARADLVLVVGSRIDVVSDPSLGARFPERLVQIDIDPLFIGQRRPVEVGIVGDPRLVLEALAVVQAELTATIAAARAEVAREIAALPTARGAMAGYAAAQSAPTRRRRS